WLRTITWNKCTDHLRKARSDREGGSEAAAWLRAAPGSDLVSVTQETSFLYRRAVELLESKFAPPTREAFCRIVLQGQAPDQVARELNVSVNAVYLAKSRVLRRLREEFADLIDLDSPQSSTAPGAPTGGGDPSGEDRP